MITICRKYLTRFLAGVVMSLILLPGCAVNPVSGEREFMLISEEQEIAMGAEGAAGVEKSIGLVDDAALQQYVQGLGLQLAAYSERPSLPWSFNVIDDPTPNAFDRDTSRTTIFCIPSWNSSSLSLRAGACRIFHRSSWQVVRTRTP